MATFIYARNRAREPFARKLAQALGIGCVDTNHRPRTGDVRGPSKLLCWGNSTPPEWGNGHVIEWIANTPAHIALASHKARTFTQLRNANIPAVESTTERNVACAWLRNGSRIYVRTVLQGHSGQGLIFLDPDNSVPNDVPAAPLYTKDYGTPFKEYRVHVAFGEVIDITQKRQLSEQEIEARNITLPPRRERLQVRTYGNGWVFTRQNLDDSPRIHELAINAAAAMDNMPIAVVDIATKWRGGACVDAVVIEINTAPALRSATLLAKYVDALRPHVEGRVPPPVAVEARPIVPPLPEPPRVTTPSSVELNAGQVRAYNQWRTDAANNGAGRPFVVKLGRDRGAVRLYKDGDVVMAADYQRGVR